MKCVNFLVWILFFVTPTLRAQDPCGQCLTLDLYDSLCVSVRNQFRFQHTFTVGPFAGAWPIEYHLSKNDNTSSRPRVIVHKM